MKRIFLLIFLGYFFFLHGASLPELKVPKLKARLKIDGKLTEAAWKKAAKIPHLTQQQPKENSPATEKTEVYVFYDENYLYIGMKCFDSQPDKIIAFQMQRDFRTRDDDMVEVLIDPFNDRRNAYVFAVNPNGAKFDGLVMNNSERVSPEWDGIWYAAASRDESGWYAELAIPFKTISFNPKTDRWGFNVMRRIKRKMEVDYWASPFYQVYFTKVAEAGYLVGIKGIKQGKGIDIRPYGLFGEEKEDEAAPNKLTYNAGLDVFYNITPALKASLTYNTDFAETEVDERRINLTRFPLFYPEKRRFFLEGSDIFSFSGANPFSFIPFYSRRIGLLRGKQVPILGGVKITGRAGDYNIGILDIATKDWDDIEGRNFFVTRISKNIWDESLIGFIFTNGNPTGDEKNSLFGVDFKYSTSKFLKNKNFIAVGYYLRSFSSERGDDSLFGFFLDYPNDIVDNYISFVQIGENFYPALGFVMRTGIRRLYVGLSYNPRVNSRLVRQFFFELRGMVTTDLQGNLVEWRLFTAPINMRTESGEHIEFNYMPHYDYLDYPFEVYEGIVIPPGKYTMDRFRFEVNTSRKRPWALDLSARFGEYYTGHALTLETGFEIKPSKHIRLQLVREGNYVRLPEGNFNAQVIQIKLDLYISPKLYLQNYVQYDDISKSWGINSRFRWIIKEGNDLFLVFNQGWGNPLDRWSVLYRKAEVKLQYTFRF